MEKMEIKLKECCLTCEHFYLRTDLLGIYGPCPGSEREISCAHMPVCKTYLESETKPPIVGWISVKNALPKEEELCLITNERSDLEVVLFSKGKFLRTDENGYQAEMPYCTHWIQIPELPK